MLIDVSRKPLRILFEECPSLVVVRSMSVRGRADGLLHVQAGDAKHTRVIKDGPTNPKARMTTSDPKLDLLESILEVPDLNELSPKSSFRAIQDPYYVISGYKDQFTGTTSIWRISFILDHSKNSALLTLLDESQGISLFTMTVPAGNSPWATVLTPIQRHQARTPQDGGEATDLWRIIRDGF